MSRPDALASPMEPRPHKIDLLFEGAGRDAAARDVAVQAFGAMGAFLENGEEGPLAYAVCLYINAASDSDQPVASVTAALSELAEYAMRRCREDHHRARYQTLANIIASCVENDPASSAAAENLQTASTVTD